MKRPNTSYNTVVDDATSFFFALHVLHPNSILPSLGLLRILAVLPGRIHPGEAC